MSRHCIFTLVPVGGLLAARTLSLQAKERQLEQSEHWDRTPSSLGHRCAIVRSPSTPSCAPCVLTCLYQARLPITSRQLAAPRDGIHRDEPLSVQSRGYWAYSLCTREKNTIATTTTTAERRTLRADWQVRLARSSRFDSLYSRSSTAREAFPSTPGSNRPRVRNCNKDS